MTSSSDSLSDDTSVRHFLVPFQHLINDDGITEIAVNGPGEVWYEKNSIWHSEKNDVTGQKLEQLGRATATYGKQKWDRNFPLLSASLPDGSRLQLVREPAVATGRLSLTIRKPAKTQYSLATYRETGLFKSVRPVANELQPYEKALLQLLELKNYEEFMRNAVRDRLNIVVSGATGSGKTTFMKTLAQEIPLSERLVTIEDVRELMLPHKNTVHLLYSKGGQGGTQVGPKELLENCLRMKPDRILLAEVRGDECLYFVRNAASGHPGSMTSCHAGSPAQAFEQMAIMIQDSKGGANLTFDVIKRLLVLTIDVVIQFQNRDGNRFISEIYYDPQKRLDLK